MNARHGGASEQKETRQSDTTIPEKLASRSPTNAVQATRLNHKQNEATAASQKDSAAILQQLADAKRQCKAFERKEAACVTWSRSEVELKAALAAAERQVAKAAGCGADGVDPKAASVKAEAEISRLEGIVALEQNKCLELQRKLKEKGHAESSAAMLAKLEVPLLVCLLAW